ncbi:hypothetical protein V1478_008695 [Vespula squamosa]|uniref:Uncharacterized protein n=1 Tax=Vespula squamosa TaxID=30214 RepID=A0ABD2AU98_VESSQ
MKTAKLPMVDELNKNNKKSRNAPKTLRKGDTKRKGQFFFVKLKNEIDDENKRGNKTKKRKGGGRGIDRQTA